MDVSENSGVYPQIILILIGGFHYFHHPFWGTVPFLEAPTRILRFPPSPPPTEHSKLFGIQVVTLANLTQAWPLCAFWKAMVLQCLSFIAGMEESGWFVAANFQLPLRAFLYNSDSFPLCFLSDRKFLSNPSPRPHNLIGSIYHFKIWRQLGKETFKKTVSMNPALLFQQTSSTQVSSRTKKIPNDWRFKVTTVSSAISPPSPLKYGQSSPSFQARLLASNSIELGRPLSFPSDDCCF